MINADQLNDFLLRYEGYGPRYTSYPTALHFRDDFPLNSYLEQVTESNQHPVPKSLSLYIHVPFCASLCYYCGCNKVVTRNMSRADEYIELLSKEIALKAPLFESGRLVEQIHFGGGTPTFMSTDQIKEILELLAQSFHFGLPQKLEMGIEIDPRSVTVDDIDELVGLGFNRFSFGIQDFNPEVQKAVNREQSSEQIEALVTRARALGVSSISFDLIYGLPKQTRASFDETLKEVLRIKPDRLALYNYAHMPDRMPAQRLINAEELPSSAEKIHILSDSIVGLGDEGYTYIGMDHFALPSDSLVKAQENGSLQRNFQGYSTHAETDLIGLGVSAISKVNHSFSQNVTKISEYREKLANDELPLYKGLIMSSDDIVRSDLIQRIMCGEFISKAAFGNEHLIDFDTYFKRELENLSQFVEDDLVLLNNDGIQVTELGRVFLRNIAMTFDHYLARGEQQNVEIPRYSKTV